MRGQIERELRQNYHHIAGVDEVGRGCLAGPVYAAAVVLDYSLLEQIDPARLKFLRDSKSLSASQRQTMLQLIAEISLTSAIGQAEAREIEALGIVPATFLAMKRALAELSTPVEFLLIDGNAPLAGYRGKQQAVIKGDSLCYAIAAASIIAKEARDQYMREVSNEFPSYGFANHVGYGTRDHLAAIHRHGPCTLHRRNFAPIRDLVASSFLLDV